MDGELDAVANMAGDSRAPELIASVAVFLPLAITAVAVRLWVRLRMIKNFGWDDAMMMMALVCILPIAVLLKLLLTKPGQLHCILRCSHDNSRVWRRNKTISPYQYPPRHCLDSRCRSILPDIDTLPEDIPWTLLPSGRAKKMATQSHLWCYGYVDHCSIIPRLSPGVRLRQSEILSGAHAYEKVYTKTYPG